MPLSLHAPRLACIAVFLSATLLIAATPSRGETVAIVGVTDTAVRSLLDDHWSWATERWPDLAWRAGDREAGNRLFVDSPERFAADVENTARFLARARGFDAATLGPADVVTVAMLVDVLEKASAEQACHFEQWRVSAKHNALAKANRFAGAGADLSPTGTNRR